MKTNNTTIGIKFFFQREDETMKDQQNSVTGYEAEGKANLNSNISFSKINIEDIAQFQINRPPMFANPTVYPGKEILKYIGDNNFNLVKITKENEVPKTIYRDNSSIQS